jgi:uncharacterized protein (DUF885 family)
MRNRYTLAVCAALGLVAGTQGQAATPESGADALVHEFVYQSLVLSPVSATSAGYHVHNGVRLDQQWDDFSPAGIMQQRKFNRRLTHRLDALKDAKLDAERLADLDIVRDNVGLNLLELEHLQSYRHNPTVYVELIGNGLYNPFVLHYASAEVRFQDIIGRLKGLPALVAQAKANLVDSPEVWNRVAQEENDGNIGLVDKTLRAETPAALQADYAAAAGPALQALRDLNDYLKNTLSKKTSDWRLGKDNYASKCALVLDTGRTPEQILHDAETDLQATRAEIARLAAPRSVEEALAAVASHHATPDTYMADAQKTLTQATDFVRQKDLLTLPKGDNLKVVETPPFMRGIYAVAGFNAAPALEPQLGAFYWVTPIPKDWPQDRIDSKLREYNSYTMQQLTIHEAMPGHYVQLEYANRLQPLARRVLREFWGNGAYIEGWAVYAQEMVTDEGYLNNDPAMRLAWLKQLLRSEANTILDIRLQTMGMTDQQALDLMMKDTYQEKEEATAKLQRAQLSSCQLAFYYSGWKSWKSIRARYQQLHPKDYSLRKFHESALNESAVPLTVLDRLLNGPAP